MTASVVMVEFLLGQNNTDLVKAKQWHAGLVNVRQKSFRFSILRFSLIFIAIVDIFSRLRHL
jgi:glycogen synthase